MALSILSMAADIQKAFIAGGGQTGNVLIIAMSNSLATAIVTRIQMDAEVLPIALVAPTGGGPVTGTGKVA